MARRLPLFAIVADRTGTRNLLVAAAAVVAVCAFPAAPVPIVATLLLTEFGSSTAIAVYVILAAVVGGLVISAAPRAGTEVGSEAAPSDGGDDRAATATST